MVFGGVGEAHPRFDAVVGSGGVGRPGDERGVRGRGFGRAKLDTHAFAMFRIAERGGVGAETCVERVEKIRIRERLDGFQRRSWKQCAGGRMFEALGGGDLDGVIFTRGVFMPGDGEIEVVAGAPWRGFASEIFQCEFAGEAERFEKIGDDEFVIVGVGDAVVGGGNELRGETAGVGPEQGEFALAGETVLGHRAANTVGGAPEILVAAIEGAAAEREQDGISAADFGDVGEVGIFRPVDDIAHGAVGEGDVPVKQARAASGKGEESRVADAPARQGLALKFDGFHGEGTIRREDACAKDFVETHG